MTETPVQSEPLAMPAPTPGRRARSVAATAVLAVMMLVSPLFVFLPAALFHCGIRNGRRAAWLALLIAAALAALLVVPAAHAPQTSAAEVNATIATLLGVVLAIGVPALLVLPLVERGESFGRVLLAGIILAVGGVAATEVIMRVAADYSVYAGQVAGARDFGSRLIVAYEKAGIPPDVMRLIRKSLDWTIYCQAASFLIYVAIVFVFSLVMLGRLPAWRDLAARRGKPLAAPYLFRNLSLPEWLLFAFVIGGVTPLVSGLAKQIGVNLLVVVGFLYLLQGLAIFRSFLAAAGAGFGATILACGVLGMLTLTGVAPLALGIAGLFDSFFDFRHFNRKDHSDESHSH